jgi:hypothetical protein
VLLLDMLLLFDGQYSQFACGFESMTTRSSVIVGNRVFGHELSRVTLVGE